MADVRCPKCGKPNSADADVCRHCNQRLAPAQGNNDFASQPAPSNEPEWLRELRSESSPSSSDAQDEPAAQEVPDWLARIRQREDQPTSDDQGADWLSGLRTESSNQETQPQGEEAWLSGLQNWQAGAESDSNQPDESPQAAEESAPDLSGWLSGLDANGETTQRAEPAPDWTAQQPEKISDEDPDLQSWFQGLDAPSSVKPEEPEADIPKESFGFTGWLKTIDTPAASPTPSSPVEMPSWLAGMEESQPTEVEPPAAAAPAEGVPSWLSGLEEPAAAQEPEPPISPSSSLPAWLAGEEPVTPVSSVPSQDQIPSWLASEEEAPAVPSQPDEVSHEDLPSWMTGFAAAEPPPSVEQPVRAPTEELPSWMAGFAAEPEIVSQPITPSEQIPAWMDHPEEELAVEQPTAPVGEVPAWLGEVAEPEAAEVIPASAEPQTDDWLAAFGKISEQPAEAEPAADFGIPKWQTNRDATQESPSTPLPFIEENLPAWLSSVDQGPPTAEPLDSPALIDEPESTASMDDGAPFKVDLPDWIGEESTQHPSEAGFAGEEEPQLELAHAELPSWVEDMRPVESAISGEILSDTDQRVEKAGPLAGLRGILPGEEIAVRYRKLPVYSVKLRVSERQRQYINLLENVIAIENQPQPVPATPSQAPQYILRLAIGLLLIFALLLPPLFNIQVTPLPSTPPAGMLELYDLVDALPNNSPVLLAVDYEPALAGEMQLASSAVIEHLMVKNARMAVVSTVPTGPIVAQQMIETVHIRQPGYSLTNQMVNLSYLAGGTTSLLEFANRPQQAAPIALDSAITGILPWQQPALQGIQNLQDFALVIVLTDSAENGRAWVEQVQPLLGQTPLAMVTSAQASPLLLPYLDSRQVQGLVSGLYGGAMYEKRSGRISLTPGYYMAYQGAFLVGILVLLLGGTISLALSTTRRSKKGKA